MTPVFKNDILNERLTTDGYVVVSLIEERDIKRLINFFYSANDKNKQAFTTYKTNDSNYKRHVDLLIKNVIHNKAKVLFNEKYDPFWGNFMLKPPSKDTDLPLHVDWQYVEEPHQISLNLWVPLLDTNAKNGALHVVPKSHHLISFPRGINLPRYYEKQESIIKHKYGKRLDLKKGEAVIYDHRLLHYSYPNLSNQDRLAASLIYVPKNTPILHYQTDSIDGCTWRYEIETSEAFVKANFYDALLTYKSREKVEIPMYDDINLIKLIPKSSKITQLKRFLFGKG